MFTRTLGVCLIPVAILIFGTLASTAHAERAVVIDDFGCSGFIPNGDSETGLPALGGVFTDTESHVVKTKSGVNILTCHFDHEIELAHATAGRGFLCSTVFGVTDDTKMIATPGGRATLVCKINGKNK